MEVVEVISQYIDKVQNLIIIEFKALGDDDDMIREDFIEYSFFEEFGFDNSKNFDIFESLMDDEDEWEEEDVDVDYINDEDNLILFLNEYYVVYPKKIPKAEYK
jgi:hypothetical protein